MLTEFVLISFIKPEERKTLNIINRFHIDAVILLRICAMFKIYARREIQLILCILGWL